MLTVACVLKSGGDYDAAYVHRLRRGVGVHLPAPHWFVCLTDAPELSVPESEQARYPIEAIELAHGWPGWWSKLEALGLIGPVLFLDLDTVVVGDLTPLAEWLLSGNDGLLMLRDFNSGLPQSGILGWGGDARPILGAFAEDVAGASWCPGRLGPSLRANGVEWRGDGEWLRAHVARTGLPVTFAQDVIPGIVSYKREVAGRDLPAGARIVAFHGHPRPAEVSPAPAWLRENWGVPA